MTVPVVSVDENTIIFIGLNKSAVIEVEALKNAGSNVAYIGANTIQNQINVGKTTYHLNKHEEVVAFVKQLNLNTNQTSLLVKAIESGDMGSRDELAQLIQIWSETEKTGKGATRFIMSGHSNSISFWGEDNGSIDVEWVRNIAKIMPKASGMVKDLYLSGCNSGREKAMMRWLETFPNVQTVWGYVDSSPGAASGSVTHFKRWNVATRKAHHDLNAEIVAKTRLGQNVVVWTKAKGYQYQKSTSVPDLLLRISQNEHMYRAYFNGDLVVANPSSGELREYYNDLLSLINHPEFHSDRINEYEEKMQTCLRVLFYDAIIKNKISVSYAELIKIGYKLIDEVVPNFSLLSRKKAIEAVNMYAKKVADKKVTDTDAIRLRDVLVNGLVGLKRSYIPDSWV